MKKLLLVSTALVGVAFVSSPASAALKMDLGGYFEGYGLYADNDRSGLDNFEFRQQSEIFFNGESTLDNGLTIGAHTQLDLANTSNSSSATTNLSGTGTLVMTAGSSVTFSTIASHLAATTSVTGTNGSIVDETYLYASGGWGRVNFGEEDGAAYLLQVAAPSADSNVDGMRVYVQGLNTGLWNASLAGLALSYQQADFRQTDRLTYLTPKFNGFQAGVSYAPQPNNLGTVNVYSSADGAMASDDLAHTFKNPWEAAARWDGEFQGVALSLGAGYSDAQAENEAASAGGVGSNSLQTYNFGGNVAISGFSLGGAYKHTNNGIETSGDSHVWDVGGAYDNGPYHAGISYLKENFDGGLLVSDAGGADVHRYAAGGGYTFGPGMTFRGSVDWGAYEPSGASHTDFTQVTVGTDVQF